MNLSEDQIQARCIAWDIEEQWKKNLIPTNANGHFVHLSMIRLVGGKIVPNWQECDTTIKLNRCYNQCLNCGETISELKLNSDGVTYSGTKCKYAKGVKYDFYLNVPSGKMVVANDLRQLFPMHGDYYINYIFNCIKTSDKYASMGLAHAFVGNTCPSMFKIDNSNFVIGTKGSRGQNPVKNAKRVAGICTDLWWYSICDFDEFQKRNKKNIDFGVDIVKCEPGYYKFTHLYYMNRTDDYSSPSLHTKIKRVSKPKPVVDYEAEYMSLNITAGQAVKFIQEKWSDIYPTFQRAAEHIVFSDRLFHPNGWKCDDPDVSNDLPDMELPVFTDPIMDHYAETPDCALAYMAGVGKKAYDFYKFVNFPKLNDSYVRLTFNLLQCLIRHGVSKQTSGSITLREIVFPKWANEALVSMANKYPNLVPSYCVPLLMGESQS